MMKTKFFYVAALIAGLSFTATSCNSDDDPEGKADRFHFRHIYA